MTNPKYDLFSDLQQLMGGFKERADALNKKVRNTLDRLVIGEGIYIDIKDMKQELNRMLELYKDLQEMLGEDKEKVWVIGHWQIEFVSKELRELRNVVEEEKNQLVDTAALLEMYSDSQTRQGLAKIESRMVILFLNFRKLH